MVELVSLIPNMNTELAIKIIEQIPAYLTTSKEVNAELNRLCEKAMASVDISQAESISMYKAVIEKFGDQLNDEKLSENEKRQIRKQMIELADKVAAKDTEHKQFVEFVVSHATQITKTIIGVGAILLGVKQIKGTGVAFPSLNNKGVNKPEA